MHSASGPSAKAQFPWALLVASALALVILLGLGTWQVQRLAWKESLLATIGQRVHAPPVPLDAVLAEGRPVAEQEYRRVTLSGIFVHQAERHFFATFQGDSGFYVYTPMLLERGDYLFVNRGFVPFDRKDAATRSQGQVEGRVTLTGLLRPAPEGKPSSIVPDNDPVKNIFYWKDLRAMRETSGLPADASVLGFFVDADDAPNPGGLPRGGVTIVDLPNNHLQYALTWYGLAAALLGVVGSMLWRRRRAAGV